MVAVRPSINAIDQDAQENGLNQSGDTAAEELEPGPEEEAEHGSESDEEEAEEPKVRRAPKGPSKEEREKH